MSIEVEVQAGGATKASDTALERDTAPPIDPLNIDGLSELITKITPLIQAGRLDNIVDLLSLISDNIEFLDEAMLEKLSKTGEEVMALGWTTGNALRMANAKTQAQVQPPTLFQLIRMLNNPDLRRSLYFVIETMTIIGQQMRNDTETHVVS